ncbi:MAG: hypothetical protein M3N28_05575 [Actinomycetota bacterium]|nr:hypothetical protein [Actinomycetota bacterium]
MLVACWSAKGGSGTTVVAAALGHVLARSSPAGVLLVDLGGDLPAALGLPEPGGPGVSDWLAAGEDVPVDALDRLTVDSGEGFGLLPRGRGPLPREGGERLAASLATRSSAVVVDCGTPGDPVGTAVAAVAGLSLLVLRPCYLAVRRALAAPIRPSGVILVSEPRRSLGRKDVEDVLGVPVRAEVAWDPDVARCVDAGLLGRRVPRALERSLRRAA